MYRSERFGCNVKLPASLQTLVASAFFACCSRTSVACVLSFRDHRIEFAIVQLSNKSTTFPQTSTTTASCAQPGPLPTARPRFQRRSAGRVSAGRQVRVRTRAMVQVVVVLEVAGRLRDVVHNLDRAIHLALADAPRGVVCDLSAVPEVAEPGPVKVLATAGRHVRDWPGIPVAGPDQRVREALGFLRQMTRNGHSNLCVTGGTHDQPRC
jgi:hypothetical protein